MTSLANTAAVKRYAHIDFMRAVALLLVLFQHAGLERSLLGSAGVTMFFVISGFVITNLVLAELDATGRFAVGNFYLRRALKIVPPLLAVIMIPSVVIGVATNWRSLNPTSVLSQVFFFYNSVIIDTKRGVLPGTDVVWSLSVEEQFYIGFAFLWLICLRLPRPKVALAWLAAVAVVYANVLRFAMAVEGRQGLSPLIYFSTGTRMDAIAVGVLMALLIRSALWQAFRVKVSNLIWDALLFASVAVLACSLPSGTFSANYSWLISLHVSTTACILLVGFSGGSGFLTQAFRKVTENRGFKLIALASYSTYLVHHQVTLALDPLVAGLHPFIGFLIKALAGLSLGFLAWLAVEFQVEKLKNQRLRRKWRDSSTVG